MKPEEAKQLGKKIRKGIKSSLDRLQIPEAAQDLIFGFISALSKAVNEPDTVQAELIPESEKERFEKAKKNMKKNKI